MCIVEFVYLKQLGGRMKQHFVTVTVLIAALVLYGAGLTSGAAVLFAAGVACELWFWVRVRRRGSVQPRA